MSGGRDWDGKQAACGECWGGRRERDGRFIVRYGVDERGERKEQRGVRIGEADGAGRRAGADGVYGGGPVGRDSVRADGVGVGYGGGMSSGRRDVWKPAGVDECWRGRWERDGSGVDGLVARERGAGVELGWDGICERDDERVEPGASDAIWGGAMGGDGVRGHGVGVG